MRDCLKIGQTTREVKRHVAERLKTAAIQNYRIELNELAASGFLELLHKINPDRLLHEA
ncbi:hypothetical protein [Meiothermus sp. CFH 77666]|uniref:hypothetical protein n=1 Tax=Meiothermus sp. CFH 77666 TaxID=2817942 RepID=UPI001AA0537C|nr:hypothetical protein [Meiothermus sp. CFH 77666]